ncbi:hypothetical protein TrCOL_g5559 [Triparma columacea]|uniref:SET domain-containing protein n=1 Tax=Triparma columacea TaxID=722753 RepID=A0A9W7FVP4_9STRA|nr:hypothetical protein TrCOL_g5559 [Triparma columacea]
MSNKDESKVWCEFVCVKQSSIATSEVGNFDGAFATKDFKEGELIERGVMRRLPMGFDGHKCEEVFTWSDERPNKTWAMGSGCAPYYNTTSKEKENTHMVRYFDENRFEIFAKRDIKAGDELFHTYISLEWRECFAGIDKIVNNKD